ncbi:hypothetical protein JVU11DRAFT_1790 [Chiua virens]|nr:hypothetical protein JVU11DRAFT_1790 [Chiua virens]
MGIRIQLLVVYPPPPPPLICATRTTPPPTSPLCPVRCARCSSRVLLAVRTSATSATTEPTIPALTSSISRTQKVASLFPRPLLFPTHLYSQVLQWLWLLQGLLPSSPIPSVLTQSPSQWTRSNPKLTVYNNNGWPGCCRPPTQSEQRLIQPADWPTVSIVHNIPMPPEIKSVLDAILARGSPHPPSVSSARTQPQHQSSPPVLDRRNSTNSPSNRPSICSSKTQPVCIPSRGRSGGSPGPQGSAAAGATPRSSAPISDQHTLSRRQTITEGTKEKSRAPSARRHADQDGSLPRRNGSVRPSLSAVAPSYSPSRPSGDSPPQNQCSPALHPSLVDPYVTSSQEAPFGRTLSSKRSTLETTMAALDISSSSGSSSDSGSSRGSMSDATVISDGAFTDYLSDESDAELQRQAEAKAALVAQNQAEELEFKAARQQLAGVGLRPPKAWDDTNESVPRATSHASAYAHHSYHSTPYVSATVAHSARG